LLGRPSGGLIEVKGALAGGHEVRQLAKFDSYIFSIFAKTFPHASQQRATI